MVLSTITGIPASRAIATTGSRSTTMPPGLARTSRKMALHRGVSARRKFSGSRGSTKWQVHPSRLKLIPNWVTEPPYRFDDETNASPGSSSVKKVRNWAAWPDAAATAARPPSRLAMRSSRTATVGLVIRE